MDTEMTGTEGFIDPTRTSVQTSNSRADSLPLGHLDNLDAPSSEGHQTHDADVAEEVEEDEDADDIIDDELLDQIASETRLKDDSECSPKATDKQLQSLIQNSFLSAIAKKDLTRFATKLASNNHQPPSSDKQLAWDEVERRLLTKSHGKFVSADVIRWSGSQKHARLALILHYPPQKGTPDHGEVRNLNNICIRILEAKFGTLADVFMHDAVPVRCQRSLTVHKEDVAFAQPYIPQFGPELWSECINILEQLLATLNARVTVCFGAVVVKIVKWLFPRAKRLPFGPCALFGSSTHMLAVYSADGEIEKLFVFSYHPERFLYGIEVDRITMLDDLLSLACLLAGHVHHHPTGFTSYRKLVMRDFILVAASSGRIWEERLSRYGKVAALASMLFWESTFGKKIERQAIPVSLLSELDLPIPDNLHAHDWDPSTIPFTSLAHHIALRVLYRIPVMSQFIEIRDGDYTVRPTTHVNLRLRSGVPGTMSKRQMRESRKSQGKMMSDRTALKNTTLLLKTVREGDHDALAKLTMKMNNIERQAEDDFLKHQKRIAKDLGVPLKEMPQDRIMELRKSLGHAPTFSLERRSIDIVLGELHMTAGNLAHMVEMYQLRLVQKTRKSTFTQTSKKELELDLAAAMSNDRDLLVDRLLSQVCPAMAASELRPALQERWKRLQANWDDNGYDQDGVEEGVGEEEGGEEGEEVGVGEDDDEIVE